MINTLYMYYIYLNYIIFICFMYIYIYVYLYFTVSFFRVVVPGSNMCSLICFLHNRLKLSVLTI